MSGEEVLSRVLTEILPPPALGTEISEAAWEEQVLHMGLGVTHRKAMQTLLKSNVIRNILMDYVCL